MHEYMNARVHEGPLEAITIIGSSLIIYHSPLHPRMRFHPCTDRHPESYRPVISAPTLFLKPFSQCTSTLSPQVFWFTAEC